MNNNTFIIKAEKIHNHKYDYSKILYKNNKDKIIIICKEHGSFLQRPDDHLKGKGCPTCGIINRSISKTLTTDEFIFAAMQIHNNKYDYSKVNYKHNEEKVIIICPIHGEFLQTPHSHLSNRGCPTCGILKNSGNFSYTWKGGVSKNNLPLYSTYAPQLEKYQSVFKIEQNGLELLGVECKLCKKIFVPKTNNVNDRIRAINSTYNEHNLYCSVACKKACPTYRQRTRPKNHKLYKENGRPDQKQWATLIKERDNYTCQICGSLEGPFVAHHIDPVVCNPIESLDLDNGITLCEGCDKKVHKLPGCTYNNLKNRKIKI